MIVLVCGGKRAKAHTLAVPCWPVNLFRPASPHPYHTCKHSRALILWIISTDTITVTFLTGRWFFVSIFRFYGARASGASAILNGRARARIALGWRVEEICRESGRIWRKSIASDLLRRRGLYEATFYDTSRSQRMMDMIYFISYNL